MKDFQGDLFLGDYSQLDDDDDHHHDHDTSAYMMIMNDFKR